MKYLVLGANGMAGHLIAFYLKEQGEQVDVLIRKKSDVYEDPIIMDASNFDALRKLIRENNYDIIVNCIGVLNKNAEDNIDNAILLNSYLPHFLAKETLHLKTKIIHMSTDCVFSGKKGNYDEKDSPDGETFYDRTKALGEIVDNKNLTFRNSIIGPDINEQGIGLFNWFMKQDDNILGYEKSIWTGVTTLTLAKAIHKASYYNLIGLYHLVNNEKISKYALLKNFNKYANKDIDIIKTDGIIHDKSLVNTRKDFAFEIPSYDIQIKDMFDWIGNHKALYNY